MENGFYAARKTDGRVTNIYIDEDLLNFAEQNRRVDDRLAADEAIRMNRMEREETARKKKQAREARYRRRKVKAFRQIGTACGICGLAVLAQVLGLATAWVTVPVMACSLVAAGIYFGMFRRCRK